jgi:hypothetical protein
MDKADFYIGIDKYAKWIGSLLKFGQPIHIPTKILLVTNPIEYEEELNDLIFHRVYHDIYKGVSTENGWPHLWEDSQMTEYSYHLFNGKVWCSMMGGQLFDPLVIIGGEDLIAAEKYAPRIKVVYPFMMAPFIPPIDLNETYCGVFK